MAMELQNLLSQAKQQACYTDETQQGLSPGQLKKNLLSVLRITQPRHKYRVYNNYCYSTITYCKVNFLQGC